jgi:hypothetical protein
MFDQLFERPHALARQLSAPLVEERRQYLSLCHAQEFSRSSLRLTAQLLVATAEYLKTLRPPQRHYYATRSRGRRFALVAGVSLPAIVNPRLSRQQADHTLRNPYDDRTPRDEDTARNDIFGGQAGEPAHDTTHDRDPAASRRSRHQHHWRLVGSCLA